MPPILPNRAARQIQALANPANQAKALSQQQQGGSSGTIPGTSSDPQQVAHTTGAIPVNPPTAVSPNGDQVAGVGIQVLNNDGNPVMVAGNLDATGGGIDLPSSFQDGGFAFVDADGNLIAGYSQETGLWGFGGGGSSVTWGAMGTSWYMASTSGWLPFGNMFPIVSPPGTPGGDVPSGMIGNGMMTQVGLAALAFEGGDGMQFYGEWDPAVSPSEVTAACAAYTLDGANSILMKTVAPTFAAGAVSAWNWTTEDSTGGAITTDGELLIDASDDTGVLAVQWQIALHA